jgi:hypothetical protein
MKTALLRKASIRKRGYREWEMNGKLVWFGSGRTCFSVGPKGGFYLNWRIHKYHGGEGGIDILYSPANKKEATLKVRRWLGLEEEQS